MYSSLKAIFWISCITNCSHDSISLHNTVFTFNCITISWFLTRLRITSRRVFYSKGISVIWFCLNKIKSTIYQRSTNLEFLINHFAYHIINTLSVEMWNAYGNWINMTAYRSSKSIKRISGLFTLGQTI